MSFEISINLSGLDALAASIESLADALNAGVKADQIISVAKQSSRKPKPVPAPVVEPEAGNAPASGPTDTATPGTAVSTAPVAETPPVVPEQSTPAAPSEPAPVQTIAAHGVDENSDEFKTARGLVLELSKTKGRQATADTLKNFGVERISQISTTEDLVKFAEVARKALAV